jgi:hypothetical protein
MAHDIYKSYEEELAEDQQLFDDYRAEKISFDELAAKRKAGVDERWGGNFCPDYLLYCEEKSEVRQVASDAAEHIMRKYLNSHQEVHDEHSLKCMVKAVMELIKMNSMFAELEIDWLKDKEKEYMAFSQLCLSVADLTNEQHIKRLRRIYSLSPTITSWFNCWHIEGESGSFGEDFGCMHQLMMFAITGKTPDETKAESRKRRAKREKAKLKKLAAEQLAAEKLAA